MKPPDEVSANNFGMRNPLLFLVLLLTVAGPLWAQEVLDNNPPSLRWYQVNSPHFRVLYPQGFEEQAQRVANSLELIREPEARSLGSLPRKISVILQSQSTVSNGFVSILPRRSELYAMPTQDYNFTGTNDWLNLLMSHEYRHIVQYQHATRGFNRLIYYLFGSISLAGMAQTAAPSWFWEGDAVVTETAFTPSGRGKIPNFGLVMKTNLLENRKFNYHKQLLGSYKHNIPNEYVLGYYMVSYLRRKTNDPGIWGRITARSWSLPFIPFAFSNAIKKEAGMHVTDLYNEMADTLAADWKEELDGLVLTPFENVNTRRGTSYTDYLYPQPLEDGSILVMKKGIGDIEQFVLLRNGAEKKVFVPGRLNDTGMLCAEGNMIVWNEYGFDPRWRIRNYSLVKTYDLSTGKKKVIGSRRSRYAGAAITSSGKNIATVETDTAYRTTLVVLDAHSGAVVKRFPNPDNHFYSMPRWSDDGRYLVALRTSKGGKTIVRFDLQSGTSTDLLPLTQENVGYPILYGNYLFFNSPVTGIDNIFALDLATGKRYQVTSSRLGAYNPAVTKDGASIVYNDQTRDGLDVVTIPFDPGTWKPFQAGRQASLFFRDLVEQEGHPDIFSDVAHTHFVPTRYRVINGLIHPYNWGLSVDSDLSEASVGLISRDVLSTTSLSLGYFFDINERTSSWRGQVSYQGWYPIIDVSASLSNRSVNAGTRRFYRTVGSSEIAEARDVTFSWKEKNLQAGLRLPLITTRSRYEGSVTIANSFGFTQVSDFTNNINEGGRFIPSGRKNSIYPFYEYLTNGQLLYNSFSVSAFRLLKQSHRDIYSKWGQQVEVQSFETPFGGDFNGRLFSVYGVLFFPGLAKHHSLWGFGGYQHTEFDKEADPDSHTYVFRNQIPVPRGQTVSRFEDFYSVSANYTLPLWYPDVAVGPLLNIQRLRTNFFFDYGLGVGPALFHPTAVEYASVGVEAKVDINIFRFVPQFDIGVRFTRGLRPSTTEVEMLLGTFNF